MGLGAAGAAPLAGQEFDYVIVGAGSAGCVLASRLCARADLRVLLLEAGGADRNPFIHVPIGIAKLIGDARIDWRYHTEPEPELGGRRLYWPRGRVLGGSSSINAMCCTRGHARDYDEWAALGASGWNYASVLPYFRKAEDQARGADEWHGVGGSLRVEDLRYRNPLSEVFVAAATSIGLRRNADFNGASQEGIGFYQVTQRSGRRRSAAVAYLHPVRGRENLVMRPHALATRIFFAGERATGVEYLVRGRPETARAAREVIVAAGAIGSPQLLMLSGVGPAQDREALGIPVRANRREVGRNLQDHLDFCTLRKCTRVVTYDYTRWGELAIGVRCLLTRGGPATSNLAEAGGFVRTHRARRAPRRAAALRTRAARRSWPPSPARPWLQGARLRAAPGEPRATAPALGGPGRPAAHRGALSERAGGPGDAPRGHSRLARDPRRRTVRPVLRPGAVSRALRHQPP